MLNCILIDDEAPALHELRHLLHQHASRHIQVLESFTQSRELLDKLDQLQPDVAFVDIHMPGTGGIELAQLIQQRVPQVRIVFVSAHREYGPEAFACNASDYLLKPPTAERLQQCIARLQTERAPQEPSRPFIRAFGMLEIQGLPVCVHWRSEKIRELFAYLLQHRHQGCARSRILDDIYPDVDPERAVKRLHNDMYYLRRNLGNAGISPTQMRIERTGIQLENIDCDLEQFEQLRNSCRNSHEWQHCLQAARIAAADYLQGEDWPWAEIQREQYRQQCQELLLGTGQRAADWHPQTAIGALQQALANDPYDEIALEHLLHICLSYGYRAIALRQYDQYCARLQNDLQTAASHSITSLIQRICSS